MARIISGTRRLATPQHAPRTLPNPEIEDAALARRNAAQLQLMARTQARQQAQEILSEARAAAVSEQAEAWQQGYLAGMEQARQEQAAITQALGTLLANTVRDHTETLRQLDETVATLALEVARLVLSHEATTAPETVLHVARAALTELSVDTTVMLRVHPKDVPILEAQRECLDLPATVPVTIIADPTLTRGGCVIACGPGTVDATIEKQLERVKRHFDDLLLSY